MKKLVKYFSVICLIIGFMGFNPVNAENLPKNYEATLYISPTCPHCHDVISYLSRTKKRMQIKDVSMVQNKSELKRLGTENVPTLSVNGRIITGSGKIISYLENN